MKLYSTNNRKLRVTLQEAVLRGLPEDKGLYLPEQIPSLPESFFRKLPEFSFQEIAWKVARILVGDDIPENDLHGIIEKSINFPAPVIVLDEQIFVLELFHGPSLAFKDFGARFMAQIMSYFNRREKSDLVILVATSGDTGGAVAAGFYKIPGIKIVILYPSGKVSPLQEKQLTTLGHNVSALEIEGTFDDCQAMVKQAFLDPELNQNLRLTSANSINIARLIPQSFYYFEAYKQLPEDGRPVAFSIPSGNFGNLTAGLIAKKMGLPIHHFIAATNINDIVPEYLKAGKFTPRPSIRTLSNAMDVGNPSNFARMLDLFGGQNNDCSTWNNMKKEISGCAFTDAQTREAMVEVADRYHYTIDPHGAVGYLALKSYLNENRDKKGVILETAHPAKFKEEVESTLKRKIEIPDRLAKLAALKKEAIVLPPDFSSLKKYLLERY